MNYIIKLNFTLLFILSLNLSIHSQPIMGIQAGINLAGFRGEKNNDENKPRIGMNAYVFTDIPLGHNSIVSIETGIALSQQGNSYVKSYDSISYTNTKTTHNKLNYIIFPIYLKENYSNFYTKIGPYAAMLTSAKSEYSIVETKSTIQFKPTISGNNKKFEDNVNKFDFGLSFGFGFIHYFDPSIIKNHHRRSKHSPIMQVDFKYNMGFKTIDASNSIPDMALKNHVFSIGIIYTSVNN
jgi:hypothetical protein